MAAPIVFFDIAGPDLAAQRDFYAKVFDWSPTPDGRVTAPVHAPLMGTFRADPAEKMLYLGVPDVTATLATIVENGGAIEAPRFEVPGVVVLGLFRDPAGNRMGLVELDGDRPKIP
jgi:predicted enzyme related to lactoylglutathione lyase